MKRIYIARNPVDAHLLKGVLEGDGVRTTVQGEFLWSARGEVPITGETSPSVWVVDDTDYERALETVKELQSSEGISDIQNEEWKCENCDEINEGQFTECWHCGTSRDVSQ
jgi:hypothetical protein